MPDGKRLLRGPQIKIPPYRGSDIFELTGEKIDYWTYSGWVDLRPENVAKWKERMEKILAEIQLIPKDDTSSRFEQDHRYWLEDKEINIGKVVGWIFSKEEHGLRMKS